MKTTSLRWLAALCLVSLIGYAASRSQFQPGDTIVIREVSPSATKLKLGDAVVVRGDYTLNSRDSAVLGLSLTTRGPSRPTRITPGSRLRVSQGSGTFELKTVIREAGGLHVSFYPDPSGSSFGGVYFAEIDRE